MIELFSNFYLIKDLYNSGFQIIPNTKGIYLVMKPKNMTITFLSKTTAISEYKGKNMMYDVNILQNKFNNSDKEILYIGKAGGTKNNLRKRISQFVKYGYKKAINHRGGRAIWQIKGNKYLLIGYYICDNPEYKEKELLQEYLHKNGTLPVANWKIG